MKLSGLISADEFARLWDPACVMLDAVIALTGPDDRVISTVVVLAAPLPLAVDPFALWE